MLVAVHGVALVLEVLDDATLRTPAAHSTATPHEHRCGPQHRVPYTAHRTNMRREKPAYPKGSQRLTLHSHSGWCTSARIAALPPSDVAYVGMRTGRGSGNGRKRSGNVNARRSGLFTFVQRSFLACSLWYPRAHWDRTSNAALLQCRPSMPDVPLSGLCTLLLSYAVRCMPAVHGMLHVGYHSLTVRNAHRAR